MNSYAWKRDQDALGGTGGSYLKFENHWVDLLECDVRIKVHITDNYRANENRPFSRDVLWWSIEPGHTDWIPMPSNLVFGNFGSRRAREAAARL
ncbi:hypothetical protein [Granulicella tundricola]|uniref:Uncharacterized protein n=1 Tax=Granulicella tundricola (strain ATCC BAA-1859 / DSM 23138 / MP5ACTX9) TaxID=1198114 RepID=E8WYC4_GRATM|nr:hypothetical protein [Granulicella tundricola]ADW69830.1 hypothetical protein AciX9_2807 [Granulicella tundricola MP5ACTX9]